MLERRFRRWRVRVNFVLIWHHFIWLSGVELGVVVAGLPQIGALQADGTRFNITERVGTAICQAAKFPERLA
jgi:hypothetical protein